MNRKTIALTLTIIWSSAFLHHRCVLRSNNEKGADGDDIFPLWSGSAIEQDPEYTYDVSISFIQIYMEMIQDLLNPNNTDVKIREDASSKVFVSGASWIPSGSIKQALNIFSVGEKNRAVAFTSLNAHSSRSHAVFMIKLEKRRKYNQIQLEEIEKNGSYSSIDKSIITSTLYLVDLAGSERVKKTKATASRLEEARKINFSLSALGK